jgi:hypothetical protein
MRTLVKILAAGGAISAALLLAGTAAADRRPERSIVLHATAIPAFFDATPACPAFSAIEQASTGSFEFCFWTAAFDDIGGAKLSGTATFDLPGGTIETTLTLVEVATATGVIQTDTGTIFRGTGRYRGATGSLSGGGPIDFDSTGTPAPDLTLTLTLGRTKGSAFNAVDTGSARIVSANGPVVQTMDTGSGRATRLGRFTLAATETVDMAAGAVTGGSFTLTGARGDTITGTYSGNALPGLTGYLVSGPITGGTGRFAGATGFLVWQGTVDPAALTFSDVITGWVSARGDEEDGDD